MSPRLRRRLLADPALAFLLFAATPASACMPPEILFAPGSTRLNQADHYEIGRIAAEFRQMRPGARLRLHPGTDGTGSARRNRWLAQRRGEVVKAELVLRGVPARAIEIRIAPFVAGGADSNRRFLTFELIEGPTGCW